MIPQKNPYGDNADYRYAVCGGCGYMNAAGSESALSTKKCPLCGRRLEILTFLAYKVWELERLPRTV